MDHHGKQIITDKYYHEAMMRTRQEPVALACSSLPHLNLFFPVGLYKGCAISAKFLMKDLWTFANPKNLSIALDDGGTGYSIIVAIFQLLTANNSSQKSRLALKQDVLYGLWALNHIVWIFQRLQRDFSNDPQSSCPWREYHPERQVLFSRLDLRESNLSLKRMLQVS